MTEVSRNPMRRALRALTHGVYVLGVRHAEQDDFLVVSLVTQCSVEPPRVAIALSANARILQAFRDSHGGALSILDVTQRAAVRRYGAPGGVRHLPDNVTRTVQQHPAAPEASFVLALTVYGEQVAGDHVLFIADVLDATALASAEFNPLTLADTGFPYAG